MKQPLNEFKRMQQLAGIITESQFTEAESITIEKIEKGRDTGMAFGAIGAGYVITLSNGKTVKSDDEDLLDRYKVIRDGRKDIDQLNTLLAGKPWDTNESQINEDEENAIEVAFQSSSKMVPWNVIEKTYTESGLTGEEFFADVEDEFRSKFENKPVNRDEYYKFFTEQPNIGGQDDLYTMVNWINFTNPKLADKLYNMI
jgi:hypothetical protein